MTLARTGQVYRGSPGPLFVALTLLWLSSAWSPAEARDAPVYQFQAPSRDGIGKVYMGREIARVMEHGGSDWLERASREREERPDQVVAAMVLTPDATVADIGAGTGYFSLRLAARVPRGRVYAVDIQPEMLRALQRRVSRAGVSNVETILGTETDPELPARSVDAVLLVDAFHEFSHPAEMLDRIYRSLRPGGRL